MYSPCDTARAVGFPIRKSSDQSLLAAPRCLSQRATSFIASQCQGIHQMPFSRSIAKPSCTGSKTPKHSTHQHNTLTRRHFPLSIWSCNQTLFIRVFENYKTSQCQRSCTPSQSLAANRCRIRCVSLSPPLDTHQMMVEPDGIEPTTSCLQSTRSPN